MTETEEQDLRAKIKEEAVCFVRTVSDLLGEMAVNAKKKPRDLIKELDDLLIIVDAVLLQATESYDLLSGLPEDTHHA